MAAETTVERPTRRRGSYAKTAATRESILDAALEVFAGSGYRAGSLRDVAERVGMSEAGLLHHFRSKSKLLLEVLTRRDELAYDIAPLDQGDGVATIKGLILLARHNATIPGVVELFCTLSAEATSTDHPAHEYFQNRYAWSRDTVHAAFADLDERGLLRDGVVPKQATFATIALMDGLQVQWLLDPELLDMGTELETYFRQITRIEF